MKKILTILFILISALGWTQSIEKTWGHTKENSPYLSLKEGSFQWNIEDNTIQGEYLHQQKLLFLYPDKMQDSIIRFKVETLTDSTLTLSKNGKQIKLVVQPEKENTTTSAQLIPNQGISTESILRGAIGMLAILIIAFIFSSNRKMIKWKTIGIGLSAQLLLAIGVLKVPFIQAAFEWVGNIFVLILDFTKAGSEFLLGGMMNVESFGFIFLFQVLPTIIFFSALTSVLFYLGVIQVIVRGLAWILTKLMGISGAESLSVAGNIFLGQTEAPLMIKAYLEKMTRSEILLVMVGGMATVAGGVLAA